MRPARNTSEEYQCERQRREIHFPERIFTCNICPETPPNTFTREHRFREHLRRHANSNSNLSRRCQRKLSRQSAERRLSLQLLHRSQAEVSFPGPSKTAQAEEATMENNTGFILPSHDVLENVPLSANFGYY